MTVRRRPHARRSALCVLGLVLGAGFLGACGHGDPTSLEVGDTAAGPAEVSGQSFDVRVPSGAIEVTVGEPVDSLTAGSRELTAPSGGALVPVTWSLDRHQTSGITGFDEETVLALVTDEGTVEVTTIPDAPTNANGSRLVTIGGDKAIEVVSATYAGLEQRISSDDTRDAGVAEELYEPTAGGEEHDCAKGWAPGPAADLESPRLRLECTVRAWTVPYLPDSGWADDDTTHLVVEPVVTLWKLTSNGDQYRATFTSATAGIAGSVVDTPIDQGPNGASSLTARLVATSVQVPTSWELSADFDLRSRFARGPLDGESVTLTGGGTIG